MRLAIYSPNAGAFLDCRESLRISQDSGCSVAKSRNRDLRGDSRTDWVFRDEAHNARLRTIRSLEPS